ncbi:group III truncated hemoglobin [Methylocystis sp. MJC1]|jgi:hemoglobin|uniref:group III truncated hemoglobin n=1 Tax=Methylocystis sp. MJC1 TaxID=2654282 RepID=UPI0013ED8001|nr:group III truncated hemoglobin [Methylocystis sp. MJC1]KAF2992359.1 Group 3 truncated hemoglobin ctb [Methylocystis sp. MJC1]MBU6527495.1 group III truncated hemoglobin [Methylocystis sp. MJC1]UZX10441.1 group III truncated hemoglobin [Methylocystis sp. MJC1]
METAVEEAKNDNSAAEAAIRACVARFYEKGGADPLLGPVFAKTISELEPHLEIVSNFWSHALLGTTRYQGTPFGVHVKLPIEVEQFPRWLSLFTEAAKETMPEELASAAIARAEHMTQCFQSGLFPFKDAEGNPSKVPM